MFWKAQRGAGLTKLPFQSVPGVVEFAKKGVLDGSRRRWTDKIASWRVPGGVGLTKNSVLEGSMERWLDTHSVLEGSRRRWIEKNSVLEGSRKTLPRPRLRPMWPATAIPEPT